MDQVFDTIIVGAGAAGLTAGIYASRAKLSTLILNEGAVGGQMVLTEEIANYPGVETTPGYVLANTMKKQAKNFGCKIKSNVKDIIFINSDNDPWGCDDKEGYYMFENIGGTLIVRHGEGHMGSNDFNQPYKEFPLLEKLIV